MNTTNNVCDEKVFKTLFEELGENLFQFLRLKYQNEALARDGMQEAFIALWKNCQNVTSAKAKNYVFTVGKNKVIDVLRQKNKHLSLVDDNKLQIEEDHAEIDADKEKLMNHILSKMPAASKDVFLLNRVQGLKYAEIADEFDISVKAVEKRMMKALKIIREELNQK
jgi:RNA polymerase sigma-70 factor (ECF subfamily)